MSQESQREAWKSEFDCGLEESGKTWEGQGESCLKIHERCSKDAQQGEGRAGRAVSGGFREHSPSLSSICGQQLRRESREGPRGTVWAGVADIRRRHRGMMVSLGGLMAQG